MPTSLARPESGITALLKEAHLLPDLSVIDGPYLQDILHQPQALEKTLDSLSGSSGLEQISSQLKKGTFKRILLTGMGSSYHALYPLNLELVGHGLTALMVETSELVHYKHRFFDPQTLVIAVSQSGRSAEMVRLLDTNHEHSPLIAITNTPDSPLARRANVVVLTEAGREFSVSCKTYLTALMALKWVGDALCNRDSDRSREELKQVIPAAVAYLANWQDHVRNLAEELRDIGHLFLVGRGGSLAAAGTGALIIKESDHFHAEGMSSATFRHGPFEMLSREIFVLVFAGDAKTRNLNLRLLHDIREQGGRAGLISEEALIPAFRLPTVPNSVYPILEILPVQMITLALAAQMGREPGRFELASKVTTTE
jgi:glucosamine--fructose-6-phosphate aminotransferase (isomerizing)